MSKYIFSFGDKKNKKILNSKEILGGKGANLSEMARLGLPVPPGFTISTQMCKIFYESKKKLPAKIYSEKRLWVVYDQPVNHSKYKYSLKKVK